MKKIILLILCLVLIVSLFVGAEIGIWDEKEIRDLTLSQEQIKEIPPNKVPISVSVRLENNIDSFENKLREYKINIDGEIVTVRFGKNHLKSGDEERLKQIVVDYLIFEEGEW